MTNWLTECDALVGVTGGIFEGAFSKTGTARSVDQTFHLEVVHDVEETHAFLSDHITFIHFNVIKIDFACAEHMPTDFVQRINLNAGFLRIDPPQRKGFFRIFWFWIAGQYQHIWILFRAGDKGFLPVEIDLTVFASVTGGRAVVVGTRSRFG